MDDDALVDCLQACAWKVSEVMRALPACPHLAAMEGDDKENALCGFCMEFEIKMGLVSSQLQTDPLAGSGTDVRRAGRELLGILETIFCGPSRAVSRGDERFSKLWALINDDRYENMRKRSIKKYLAQPRYVTKTLMANCEKLLEMLNSDDLEVPVETEEPEDHSRTHQALFGVLQEYTVCKSCPSQTLSSETCSWHPTRLFMMDPIRKSDSSQVQFDIISSSVSHEWWQDLCIQVSSTTARRVAFVEDQSATPLDDFESSSSVHQRIDDFCQILQCDDGCRISLKLQNDKLFRLGDEALKHRPSPGKGLPLSEVLVRHVLEVGDKLALAHAVASAFWQYYNSPLMNRAWTSNTIWLMPQADLWNDSEQLPLRAYISFHPDATECDFDAAEFTATPGVIHRCPRIQSLATLLLEIGLGKPFHCPVYEHQIKHHNCRHLMASMYVEELKAEPWEDFSHKDIYTKAVEECLTSDGLMGKDTQSNDPNSDAHRRQLLHADVVSPLEWLYKYFRKPGQEIRYLTARPTAQEAGNVVSELDSGSPAATGLAAMESEDVEPTGPRRPASRSDFEIAVVCALTIEANAVEALFDHFWDRDGPDYNKAADDPNAYTTGSIGHHNVVLAHMPGMGKKDAATVATNCRRSFPSIKLALVVGICGAVPYNPQKSDEEIVLGDVIVSESIIQYDYGRRFADRFERKSTIMDSLGRPNTEIRGFLTRLQTLRNQESLTTNTLGYLTKLQGHPKLEAGYPGAKEDMFFRATGRQQGGKRVSCEKGTCHCKLVPRKRLAKPNTQHPKIHLGLMASGDTVMKSAKQRDELASQEKVIGFEMESAGVWDTFPCVVIKGACDYADGHKTKAWQKYAAATAAACMRAFLDQWTPKAA